MMPFRAWPVTATAVTLNITTILPMPITVTGITTPNPLTTTAAIAAIAADKSATRDPLFPGRIG